MKSLFLFSIFITAAFGADSSESRICPKLISEFHKVLVFEKSATLADKLMHFLSIDKRLADTPSITGMYPIVIACTVRRDPRVVEIILDAGVDVNRKYEESRDATMLHTVAMSGRIDLATLLLKHHANINAKDIRGRTPMHYSQYAKEPAKRVMFEFFKSRGGDATIKDIYGDIPINLNKSNAKHQMALLRL